jgi:serine protease AprX
VSNTGDQDAFGHGTFMAGLIAANDDPSKKDGTAINLDAAPPAAQEGLAPDAQLLSVKLAGADGSTSVDAVIAALAWVVQHRNDNGMNVRVVNLSFGATALQPYQIDPLAAAVEAAWRSGIVVVASAGNDGPSADGLTDPALDPFVIAVGSSDPQGKVDGWGHPVVADFSSSGTPDRPVDLLAPGRSVVSLRVPGSTIDTDNPEGLVAGDGTQRLFRGSGTSEATAVVSGAVALLLQAHPELTPDQLKALLMATARPLKHASVEAAGSGEIQLGAALDAADKAGSKDAKVDLTGAAQAYPASSGLDGVDPGDLSGSWDGARWSGARWSGARWSGARWSGARWSGKGWS